MDSPASNTDFTGQNSSMRGSDEKGEAMSSNRPNQDPMGAAAVPSAPENRAYVADYQTQRAQAMGVAAIRYPPTDESPMADYQTRTIQSLDVASAQYPSNNQFFPAGYQPQGSQPMSKGIIIISVFHFLAGLLTCGFGIAITILLDDGFRNLAYMDYIWNTLLFVATGIVGLCYVVTRSSARSLIIGNMVMNIICVTFAAYGVKELAYDIAIPYYRLFEAPFVICIVQIVVYFLEFVCAIVGSSLLCYKLNAAQRAVMTQMGVTSVNPNVRGVTEANTVYRQPASSTGQYVRLGE